MKSASMFAGVLALAGGVSLLRPTEDRRFTDSFGEDEHDLGPTGRNPFMILEPGYTIELQGKEKGKDVSIVITVLDETRRIAGVETRVVEERETAGGELKEVTRDFYAISKRTNNVYYFGEAVDNYQGGQVTGHQGSWIAGEDGARYGLAMPGCPLLGSRFQEEIAPGKAMDRSEIVALDVDYECPAGKFTKVLKVEETTPLEADEKEFKLYAPGVGLLEDESMKLVRYGKPAK